MSYGISKTTNLDFDEAVEKTKNALNKEGFGILTEIDVKKTLKEKLNLEHDDYVILGACNPQFAHKALQLEKEIGLLMPCNVIVYSQNGRTVISAINPVEAMSIIENEELKGIALQVREKLKRAIKNLNVKGKTDGD